MHNVKYCVHFLRISAGSHQMQQYRLETVGAVWLTLTIRAVLHVRSEEETARRRPDGIKCQFTDVEQMSKIINLINMYHPQQKHQETNKKCY